MHHLKEKIKLENAIEGANNFLFNLFYLNILSITYLLKGENGHVNF